ncbi:hypothetical protein G6F56_014603 [Rhizopus delemar]|nr:hypothetical protein G6F56_014603 [Rhizopus delemar]
MARPPRTFRSNGKYTVFTASTSGAVQRNAGLAGVEVVGGIEIDAALGSERVVAEAVVEDDLAAGFIGTWRQGIRACPRYEQA